MFEEEFSLVQKTVLEVGELLKSYFGSIRKFNQKEDTSLVSKADEEAELILKKTLLDAYPKSHFIGEETGDRPGLENHKRKWAVDPLDGTTNFLYRIPYFCTSVGMAYDGEWVLGVVYNPITNEMFHAIKGKGAYCNGRKIKASRLGRHQEAVIAMGRSFSDVYDEAILDIYKELSKVRATRSLGSAALDLAYTADARFDLQVCKALQIWDTAAAFTILKEAGAMVSDFKGEDFSPEKRDIVAGSPELIKLVLPLLKNI